MGINPSNTEEQQGRVQIGTMIGRHSKSASARLNLTSATFPIVLIYLLIVAAPPQVDCQDQANGLDLIGLSVAQIARLRNYTSEEHHIITPDGYSLLMTRILNPYITDYSQKPPLLLVHGLMSYGVTFVVNSANARPRDYSNLNTSNLSASQIQMLADDPNSNSIAFLASSCGYEVWIICRRGTPGSRNRISIGAAQSASYNSTQANTILSALGNFITAAGASTAALFSGLASILPQAQAFINGSLITSATFDPEYWNFSLDEETKYDIPTMIDYVLAQTNQSKLIAIGHSSGGAIILMSQTINQTVDSKIATPILWAPAIYIDINNSNPPLYALMAAISPVVQFALGPFFPDAINALFKLLFATFGTNQITSQLFLAPLFSLIFGYGSDQQFITSGFADTFPFPSSAHEFDQFYQVEAIGGGRMHTYDFGSASANQAAYGSPTPLLYNVSRITNRNMKFWYGNTDALVAPENRLRLYQDLSVPYTANFIDGPGIVFNHQQFFIHKDVNKLLVIPTLQSFN